MTLSVSRLWGAEKLHAAVVASATALWPIAPLPWAKTRQKYFVPQDRPVPSICVPVVPQPCQR